MKWPRRFVRLIQIASILTLYASAAFSQDLKELDSTAKGRIELARASIVTAKIIDEQTKTISQAKGFLIRKDLIATDLEIDKNSRLQVTVATEAGPIKVISSGHYFLPYVLVETQAENSPLSLGDSERVALNDPVYMLSESGTIVSGRVTGFTTIKKTRAFSMSLPINANDKGAPVFDRYGEVIGIATKSPDVQSAGLAWPSQLLADLKHLGEPGVGIGRGDGSQFGVGIGSGHAGNSIPTLVDTKPVPLKRQMPRYTELARAHGVQGSVLMRVLVGEDGNVKLVRVIRGLPDGLTEEAISAARQTTFKPAMKDGKPVPFWVGLEMNFNIR
jgi:TonB family protein